MNISIRSAFFFFFCTIVTLPLDCYIVVGYNILSHSITRWFWKGGVRDHGRRTILLCYWEGGAREHRRIIILFCYREGGAREHGRITILFCYREGEAREHGRITILLCYQDWGQLLHRYTTTFARIGLWLV